MEKLVLAFLLGGAVAIYIRESIRDLYEKKISTLLAPKIETLIAVSSLRIGQKQKELNRALTEDEKNKIFDDCYNEI